MSIAEHILVFIAIAIGLDLGAFYLESARTFRGCRPRASAPTLIHLAHSASRTPPGDWIIAIGCNGSSAVAFATLIFVRRP